MGFTNKIHNALSNLPEEPRLYHKRFITAVL